MTAGLILVVEDDPDLLEVLRLTFQREGFRTVEARDGRSALEAIRRNRPDLVVLDVMMPEMDGIEVCRRMRADAALAGIPVLMLTARGEEADVVLGLGIGADDYVVKPARPRELVARVRNLLRRREGREGPDGRMLSVGGLVIEPDRFEVRVDGEPIAFTPTEFRILQALAGRPGRVFRRSELLEYASGAGAFVEERTVDTHVKSIRAKLGPRADLVETVRGLGYRLRDVEGR